VIQADLSDDKFLECAVAGKAFCIASGDKHLLKLLHFRGIPILRPRELMEKYLRGK
jgi:predicted nucleic acid-binding protein